MARIAGVSLGLVSVPRFSRAVERFGERMQRRVFSEAEWAYAARKRAGAQNLAARFAAKCAGRRALAGLVSPLPALRQLEVVRRRTGEPTLAVRDAEPALDGLVFRISLTHDADFALASIVVEREW